MNWIRELIDYITNTFRFWMVVNPWESGLRVRFGKWTNILSPGVHLKIPFVDSAYIQTTRIRVVGLSPQTVTTIDKHTLTISSAVGYSITSIFDLYNSIYHPQATIVNIIKGEISSYISSHVLEECTQENINESVKRALDIEQYGLKFHYVKIISYAVVRTFRLIQDQEWMDSDLSMDKKQ